MEIILTGASGYIGGTIAANADTPFAAWMCADKVSAKHAWAPKGRALFDDIEHGSYRIYR